MAASLQHFGRASIRVAKNYTKGYSNTQTKVREATSNDPWGPSGTQMNEIAQLTYNQGDFVEIMEMLDKRLNDKGKNWRHVFKALTLLDYCLHAGSENVVIYFKDNLYIVKTLKEFVYVDDQGKDVGHNVRQKAKDITNLLNDEERLRAERRQRGAMRDRMLGNIADSGLRGEEDFGNRPPSGGRSRTNNGNGRRGDEDDDLQRALQASIDSTAEDERRRQQQLKEEDELAKAIRESTEEEARRKREAEEATKNALMDESFQLESNNQYAQQQQSMQTGFPLVNLQDTQPLQPQFTSYNPFYQQMLQQQQQQQQQEEFMRQQMMMQQQQQQQEEYMRQQMLLQQQQQQQQLFAQPTGYGSNNPFAPQTSLLEPQPTATQSSFNPMSQMSQNPQPQQQQQPTQPSINPTPASKPSWQAPQKKDDGEHADLANLLGRGREDGLDTFGNQGNMRIPTGAPFHQSNRMAVQQTGMGPQATGMGAQNTGFNPFAQQQQQKQNNDQPFFQI